MSKWILKSTTAAIGWVLVLLSVCTMIIGIFAGGMMAAWRKGYVFGSEHASKINYLVGLN